MRIIISPAKKMKIDTDSFDVTPLLFAERVPAHFIGVLWDAAPPARSWSKPPTNLLKMISYKTIPLETLSLCNAERGMVCFLCNMI